MRRGIIALLVWWGLSGPAAPVLAQEADYVISHYDLIFKLSAGSADAEVELDITYEVRSGVKYDGFKYTGDFEPVEVSATDELGNPLPAGVRREREYQVYWRFPPVQRGSQRVIVRFRLRDVLEGTREGGNVLEAPWAGVFRVPVRRGAYTIVFPPGFVPEMQGRAARQYIRRSFGGQELLTFTQEPLQQQRLSVRFRPGLVDWRRRSEGGSLAIWPIVALFAVGLGGLGSLMAYRGGAWGDSFSSGGCGGGGCGGGCGGGGCGGGCGG